MIASLSLFICVIVFYLYPLSALQQHNQTINLIKIKVQSSQCHFINSRCIIAASLVICPEVHQRSLAKVLPYISIS